MDVCELVVEDRKGRRKVEIEGDDKGRMMVRGEEQKSFMIQSKRGLCNLTTVACAPVAVPVPVKHSTCRTVQYLFKILLFFPLGSPWKSNFLSHF